MEGLLNGLTGRLAGIFFAQDLKRSLSADMTVFQPRASAAEDRLRAIASGQQSGGVPGVVHESGEEGEWEGGQREPEPEIPYDVDDIINEGCFLERARLETMLERLRTKKNLILQGPPGTGKTWLAKKLAFALIGNRSDRRVRPFQFHPNLSYEDFVRGWRPGGRRAAGVGRRPTPTSDRRRKERPAQRLRGRYRGNKPGEPRPDIR